MAESRYLMEVKIDASKMEKITRTNNIVVSG